MFLWHHILAERSSGVSCLLWVGAACPLLARQLQPPPLERRGWRIWSQDKACCLKSASISRLSLSLKLHPRNILPWGLSLNTIVVLVSTHFSKWSHVTVNLSLLGYNFHKENTWRNGVLTMSHTLIGWNGGPVWVCRLPCFPCLLQFFPWPV